MEYGISGTNAAPRIRFAWILDPKKDLRFYIGSALAGWLYVGVILFAIMTLENPLEDAFAVISLGAFEIPLNLRFLVLISWAFILDAPHVWATLGRTLFDPDEWKVRRREILFSFVWFLVGPAFIFTPYLIGGVSPSFGYTFSSETLALGALIFFVLFRLWAYYHVVRQHWGFFNLYKRKNSDFDNGGRHDKIDKWFFNTTLYMPLLMFMTSAFYSQTPGQPELGLRTPIWGEMSVGSILYPVTWAIFLGMLLFYAGYQFKLWQEGKTLNGSKLLYMALIIPLHLVAFSHPIMAVFIVPLVTVGHNIQYHCIVYQYAQNKYLEKRERQFRVVKWLFKNFAIYATVGLIFTFAFYKGPWIGWLKSTLGLQLDEVMLNSIGMMAGIENPAALGLGEQMFAAFIVGFAMQHYYLDSKIWRVSKDKSVAKNLNVQEK